MPHTSSARQSRVAAVVSLVVSVLGLMVVTAAPASAHTDLASVTPGPGERVGVGAPLTVSLTFTEAIDPALANVVVVDSADDVVESTPPSVDGPTVTLVTADVLEPGRYVVRYRVVSADGHPVDGKTGFKVAAPRPAADPTATSAAEDSATPEPTPEETQTASQAQAQAQEPTEDDGGNGRTGLAVGAVAVVGLVGVLAAVARRRSARAGSDGA
jgi:hypothetical protein